MIDVFNSTIHTIHYLTTINDNIDEGREWILEMIVSALFFCNRDERLKAIFGGVVCSAVRCSLDLSVHCVIEQRLIPFTSPCTRPRLSLITSPHASRVCSFEIYFLLNDFKHLITIWTRAVLSLASANYKQTYHCYLTCSNSWILNILLL